jgi:hypothetical protein
MLLSFGASVAVQDNRGENAFHCAATAKKGAKQCVDILLKRMAGDEIRVAENTSNIGQDHAWKAKNFQGERPEDVAADREVRGTLKGYKGPLRGTEFTGLQESSMRSGEGEEEEESD